MYGIYFQRSFSGHTDYVLDLALRPGNKELISVSEDGTARVWGQYSFNGHFYDFGLLVIYYRFSCRNIFHLTISLYYSCVM